MLTEPIVGKGMGKRAEVGAGLKVLRGAVSIQCRGTESARRTYRTVNQIAIAGDLRKDVDDEKTVCNRMKISQKAWQHLLS